MSATLVKVRVVDTYVFRKIQNGYKFLMLKRAETKIYEHLWQGVAGKIEAGETAWQAAVRELKEDNKKLAHQIEDRINRMRKSGL